MKYDFIDKYASFNSPVHSLRPSTKLVATFLILLLLIFALPFLGYQQILIGIAVISTLLILTAVISKVPLNFLVSRSALVLPFSALIILVNYISGNFDGFKMFQALFKSLLSIFTLLLLTSTTPFHGILKQLSRWGAPKLIVIILSFMYRYFFLLALEIEALERTLKMRHPTVAGWYRVRLYANMVGMLFIHSYDRAGRVYQAMQMRGFSGDLT